MLSSLLHATLNDNIRLGVTASCGLVSNLLWYGVKIGIKETSKAKQRKM